MVKMTKLLLLCLLLAALPAPAQPAMPPGIWVPDQGDGSYANPVLQGDYSDPDVVRVGNDYFLTASSFTQVPGLPVLQSRDLVNWTLVGHALPRLLPQAHHSVPRRGGGVWAPALRHHWGRFHIYYPDPDFGVFLVTAADAAGPWTEPVLVEGTRGVIDPAPYWDDDGQGWLVYAYAKSRSGRSNTIALKKLNANGTRTVGDEHVVIDGDSLPPVDTSGGLKPWVVLEGPKLYRRDGWYYIFAPAGGVKGGWQGVFRARSILGPYEGRNVMDQGSTPVNGPHQGAWVTTPGGQHWFVHFQDTDSYGRRVHLQPMAWGADGWPVIGEPQPGKPFGQPVLRHAKPDGPAQAPTVPLVNDRFEDGPHLGWQWNANPAADWRDASVKGLLRLKAISSPVNLWESGQVLSQKLPGLGFTATTRLAFAPKAVGERAGLTVFGASYGWIGVENRKEGGPVVVQVTRMAADAQGSETVSTGGPVQGPVWLRTSVRPVVDAVAPPSDPSRYWPAMARAVHARVAFSYSLDGKHFIPLGEEVTVLPGRWVGAQLGLFAQAPSNTPAFVATSVGHADFEFFGVE